MDALAETVEVLKLEKVDLEGAVLESSWNTEREALLQAIEEEKEKVR